MSDQNPSPPIYRPPWWPEHPKPIPSCYEDDETIPQECIMDPTQTLIDLLAKLYTSPATIDNREECIQHLDDLSQWLDKGGYFPDVMKAVDHVKGLDARQDQGSRLHG